MYCKKCGTDILNDSKFCYKCGEKVLLEKKKTFCTRCGKQIESDLNTCPFCGKSVNDDKDFESIILEVLSFFVPLVGFVLWLIIRKKTPSRALGILKWSLMGVVFKLLYRIIRF